ncbi:MAG: hypothetical protein WA056_02435 [Gallionella sp.]
MNEHKNIENHPDYLEHLDAVREQGEVEDTMTFEEAQALMDALPPVGEAFWAKLKTLNQLSAENKASAVSMLSIPAIPPMPSTKWNWRGATVIPKDSALEKVLDAFYNETDIPLELPLFSVFHYLSGYLVMNNVVIKSIVGTTYPEMWNICIADSGSSKTLSHSVIASCSPVKSTFKEPASGAGFIQCLEAEGGTALWFQDEVAQILKKIDGGVMNDVKDYLFKAYTNEKIERSTKNETITVDIPVLGIFGLNTPESLFKAFKPDSFLDGFMQRFGIIHAAPDPERDVRLNPMKYALYNIEALKAATANVFDVLKSPIHSVYSIDDAGLLAFRVEFAQYMTPETNVSFYKRLTFRAFKYGLIYHILFGKTSSVIDKEDIEWAMRVVNLHLQDLQYVLKRDADMNTLSVILETARKVQAKFLNSGKKFTHTDLQRGTRLITNAEQAKMIFGLLQQEQNDAVAA